MLKDSYDKILCFMLVVTIFALAMMLFNHGAGVEGSKAQPDRSLERAIAYQSRVDYLRKIYAPVESLRSAGKYQDAMFRLDELSLQYPNDPHGKVLRGEILYRMGTLEEAVASIVEGVRLNGDYVDRKSPLSRRDEIGRIAEEGLRVIGGKARANPGNQSLQESLRNVNYLRSRLAGGCE